MEYNFLLVAIEARDGFYVPALCLKASEEVWYVFIDSAGVCFRRLKGSVKENFTIEEMKKNYFGTYRLISSKWNEISAVLKKIADGLDIKIKDLFTTMGGPRKTYVLAEKVADYLKTKNLKEVEKADKIVKVILEK